MNNQKIKQDLYVVSGSLPKKCGTPMPLSTPLRSIISPYLLVTAMPSPPPPFNPYMFHDEKGALF
jgi:hypothetical protein